MSDEEAMISDRLRELRAAAEKRLREMPWTLDTPEEIAERSELTEAMMGLQLQTTAWQGDGEPLIYNGDQITVNTPDGNSSTYKVEAGGIEPGVVPLYRVGGQKLTCRKVED